MHGAIVLALLVALPCTWAFGATLPQRPHPANLVAPAVRPDRGGAVAGQWRWSLAREVPTLVPGRAEAPAAVEVPDPADQKAPFEAEFDRAALGTGLLTIAKGIEAAFKYGTPVFLFACCNLTALLLTRVCLQTLRSAAARNRLSGGTFRVLSLASLLAFSAMLFTATFQVLPLAFLTALTFGNIFTAVPPFVGFAVAIFITLPAIRASWGTLVAEGLPKFKLAVRAEKGHKDLLTLLAVGYAVTTIHQVIMGGALFELGDFMVIGALRCFVVAAVAHVCQTAAVAGPKRLSSETYRRLNLALMLDRAMCLILAVNMRGSWLRFLGGCTASVGLLSAGAGWAVGKLYSPE